MLPLDVSFATCRFDDQHVFSMDYQDRYCSQDRALQERHYVYLLGGDILTSFASQRVAINAEIGFGLGLNFLSLLDLWRKQPPSDRTLVYISVEQHPLTPHDLHQALQPWKDNLPIDLLLDAYHSVAPGLNTWYFLEERVVLILLIGPAQDLLPLCRFQAHHWMLDGFSPSKNPLAWSAFLIEQISRLSAPKATLSTFTSAGNVNRSLTDAHWQVSKRKGFGHKRHHLLATFQGTSYQRQPHLKQLIWGNGIAGVAYQYFCTVLGLDVPLLDGPYPKASSVPYIYGQPSLQFELTPQTLLAIRSHLMSAHFYRQFCKQEGLPLAPLDPVIPRHERQSRLFQKVAAHPLMRSLLTYQDGQAYFPLGFCLNGPLVLQRLREASAHRPWFVHSEQLTAQAWQKEHPDGFIFFANSLAFQQKKAPECRLSRGQLGAIRHDGHLVWQKSTFDRYGFDPLPQCLDPAVPFKGDFVGFRSSTEARLPYAGFDRDIGYFSVYHGFKGFSTGLWYGLVLALRSNDIFSFTQDSCVVDENH